MKTRSNNSKCSINGSTKTSSKQNVIFDKFASQISCVSTYKSKKDNQPKRKKLTWEMTIHDVRPSKDGMMFNASKFSETRGNDFFEYANAMFLDFDKGNPSIEKIQASLPDILKWIYTTHSHTQEKPRYRVVLPLSRRVDKKEHLAIGRALKAALPPEIRDCLDVTCFERARPHYFPACLPKQANNAQSCFYDGSPLNANELIAIGIEIPSDEKIKRGTKADLNGDRPGDDYVRRHTIEDTMFNCGWTNVSVNYYAKPGDTSGDHHAKLHGGGVYVYSTSAPVPAGYHDAFSFLVHSRYRGDFSSAAVDLRKKGYGATSSSKRLFMPSSHLLMMQKETDSLVGNLIRQGTTGQIFGPSEAGKTFVALDLALCIATGKDWNGYKCQKGLVIYCIGEGWSGFRNRIDAWQTSNGNPDIRLFHTSRNVINFEQAELEAAADELKLYEQETGHKVGLIVIDTLARHLAGDENSSSEISRFVNKVDALRDHFPGSAAIIVHHSGHGNGDRARGSSALRAAMDFEMNCSKNSLTFTKMKDGAKPDPIAFVLDVVEIGNSADGEPITSCVVSYGKKPESLSSGTPAAKIYAIENTAIKALKRASIKHKKRVAGKYGAHIDNWRSSFYGLRKKETNHNVLQNTLKTSFRRAKKKLLELGHIEQVENFFVLTGRSHQSEIEQKINAG